MKAMILAAGRGERMRPLTDNIPKPLLQVGKYKLIEYHLMALKAIGINEIMINVSYRAQQIMQALGNGQAYGVNIHYSFESEVLETGGGIFHALHLLGDAPFIVINGDILTNYPLQKLLREPVAMAHLVLVDNRAQDHPHGDFYFPFAPENTDTYLELTGNRRLTFSGIGLYRPELFADCMPGRFPLGNLLRAAIERHQITGEYYQGFWLDVGTPERLTQALQHIATNHSLISFNS